MAFEIRLTSKALEEMEGQVDWYENRQEGLGTRFTEAVDKRLALLCDHLDMFAVKASGYREVLVRLSVPKYI